MKASMEDQSKDSTAIQGISENKQAYDFEGEVKKESIDEGYIAVKTEHDTQETINQKPFNADAPLSQEQVVDTFGRMVDCLTDCSSSSIKSIIDFCMENGNDIETDKLIAKALIISIKKVGRGPKHFYRPT